MPESKLARVRLEFTLYSTIYMICVPLLYILYVHIETADSQRGLQDDRIEDEQKVTEFYFNKRHYIYFCKKLDEN